MQDNLAARIGKTLPKAVLEIIKIAGLAASKSGQRLYLVGGIVRDLLLGRESKDIDIMAGRDAIALAGLISASLKIKPVIHTAFGTATFNIGDYRLDLATCRSESYDHPGALPKVKPGHIRQDLFRRDFTINAMAACINPEYFGEVIDLYGGRGDLDQRLVRVLHENSFVDDATRIMRAVRYEQRLGFRLERKTARLLCGDTDMLDTISGDRLRHEVVLWLSEPRPGRILKRAAALGILKRLHPALAWDAGLGRAFHSVWIASGDVACTGLYLSLLTYGMSARQAGEFLARLNITGGELRRVALQTISLKSKQPLLDKARLKRSDIYVKLEDFDAVAVRANALMAESGVVRSNLRLYLNKLCSIKPLLNGKDLAVIGVPEGRKMGIILNRLLMARLDGEARTTRDEENLVRQWLKAL